MSQEEISCDTNGSDSYDEGYADPGNDSFSMDSESSDPLPQDTETKIEAYDFECLTPEEVDRLMATTVNELMGKLMPQDAALARMLLHHFGWNTLDIQQRYNEDRLKTLEEACGRRSSDSPESTIDEKVCQTCFQDLRLVEPRSLECGHEFCIDCWIAFLEIEIDQGHSTEIACMSQGCGMLAPTEFVRQVIAPKSVQLEIRYLKFCRNSWVRSHPQLRYCPGNNCEAVIKVDKILARRVNCTFCQARFCCKCGSDYHAPTDCDTIKKWQIKLLSDSEMANYIVQHTKDCPYCKVCIEKNGGCNHMKCWSCKKDFCWLCVGKWESYEHRCSTYTEGKTSKEKDPQELQREAYKKYLFYFQRWAAHAESLKLEKVTEDKIQKQIHRNVMAKKGTWIDWQYLLDAAALLAECRYTLQYTYPLAYFLESGPRKVLFEYRQAALEREIENLSWNLENAEVTQRGELANQMVKVDMQRKTLLQEFLES